MLRQPLLLVGLFAAATLLRTAEAFKTLDNGEEGLRSFTWLASNETSTLRVCFSSMENITKPFQLTYYYNSTCLFSTYSDAPDQNGSEVCGNVVVDESTLDYDSDELYMVNGENVHLAAQFTMKIRPGVLHAESLTFINTTRVGGLTDYEIEGCEYNENGYCYIAGSSTPPDSLCTQVEDSMSSSNIRICDSTFSVKIVDDQTQVMEIELLYDSDIVQVKGNSESSTLQVLIYDGFSDNFTVCEMSTCPVSGTPGTSVYTLVIVELDDNFDAMSSNLIDVQDVNMLSMWVSDDAVGVSWEGPEDAYKVTVGEDAEGTRTVNCADCAELFIHRNSTQQSITVTYGSPTIKVEASLSLEDKPTNVSDALASLSHTVSFNDTSSITTEVCVKKDQFDEFSSLFIVDSSNKRYSTSFFGTNNCASVEVDTPTDVMRVIVTGSVGSRKEPVSTQADLFFFMPQLELRTSTTARASWKNLNKASSYSVLSPSVQNGSASNVQCLTGSTQSCRYYVAANDQSSMSFTLVENDDIVQTTTTILEQLDVEELAIDTELRKRYDDHLLVCYNPLDGSTSSMHELGMEREGELVVSDDDPQTDQSTEQLCLVTSEPVQLGAYVRLWALVAELDAQGNVKRSGEQIFEDLYLSADMGVYALVTQQNSTFIIRSSWKLVDDTVSLTDYTVSLYTEKGNQLESAQVPITQSTYTFKDVSEDLYIICVVVNGDGFYSEQVCSDVIRASAPVDAEDIPEVEQSQALITSDNTVKVSWSLSDDELEGVTAFFIEFGETTEDGSKERALGKTPLSHVGTMQRDSDSKASFGSDAEFRIIPVSQTTVELPLSKGSWKICVSAMKGNQAGESNCVETVVDNSTEVVPPPVNVAYNAETATLKWDAPPNYVSSDLTYYIEVKRATTIKGTTTSQVSFDLTSIVNSGEWTVSVQTVLNGRLSTAVSVYAIINGIEITLEQTGKRVMRVEWSESGEDPSDGTVRRYTVSFGEHTVEDVLCTDECFIFIEDADAAFGAQIYIAVKNEDTGTTAHVNGHFDDIPSVSELKSSYRNELNATILWGCVDEASSYNVSLYNASKKLKFHDVTATCSYTFDDPSFVSITNDNASVQACTVKSSAKHPTRCGDPLNIAVKPLQPEEESDNTLAIVLGSVVGVLVLVVIAGLLVVFLKPGKNKSKPKTADVELHESPGATAPPALDDDESPPLDSLDDGSPDAGNAGGEVILVPPVSRPVPTSAKSTPPHRGPDPRSQRNGSYPPRNYEGRPPPISSVPHRFSSRHPSQRQQSLSPVRHSRRGDYEAQQGYPTRKSSAPPPRRGAGAPYHSSQPTVSPNRRGPGPRPGPRPPPRPTPRTTSYDRGSRPATSADHMRYSSQRPPRPYSSGPTTGQSNVPSGQSRSRYSGY